MKDIPIQIGPINLRQFEIPPSIRFGGRHRLAIHRLSTGERVVERLGPDDSEISFQGTFSGPDAEARARAFDNLRLSGDIVWLTWESFRRPVVVKSFIADYHSPSWIPFRVSCVVVHQDGVVTSDASTVTGSIMADLGNALSLGAALSLSFDTLQSALSNPNALTAGTSNNTQAAAAVRVGLSAINNKIAEQSALLVVPDSVNGGPSFYSSGFGASVNSAGLLAAAVNARSYVGRIGVNLDGSDY